MKYKKAAGFFVALLALFVVLIAAVPEGMPEPVTVAGRVIDGDTLEVNGKSVRLLGVDAAEKSKCFYEEAKQELARLTLDQPVRLESDPLNNDTDEYGRLLRYVYLPDGTLINAQLISNGFARHLSWFPIEQNGYFAKLESEAREKDLGLWEVCGENSEEVVIFHGF